MLLLFNLILSQIFPGLADWILRLQAASADAQKTLGPEETAKALSAIAAILILGLGGVLMIALTGRWLRRLVFKKVDTKVEPSADSKMGKLDWATSNPKDSATKDSNSSQDNRSEE